MYVHVHAMYNNKLAFSRKKNRHKPLLFQRFKVTHARAEEQQAEISLRIFLFALFSRVVLLRRVQQVVVLVEVELLN